MKTTRLIMMAAMMLLTTTTASAKKVITPKVYMYGFAASFNDSIVHFTDIQTLDSVWIDSKTGFLLGRENYSFQLRDYLGSQQMPQRTCIVVYNTDRKKLEKKFVKMKRLYTTSKDGRIYFDVRYLEDKDFHFTTVDMSDPIVEAADMEEEGPKTKKAPKPEKRRKPEKLKKK